MGASIKNNTYKTTGRVKTQVPAACCVLHSRLHVPYMLLTEAMSSKSNKNLNVLRVYLALNMISSGNINANHNVNEKISELTNLTTKTVKKHLNELIILNYINFNEKSNTFFIKSLDKISLMKNFTSKKAVIIENKDLFELNKFKAIIFASVTSQILTFQEKFKKKKMLIEYFNDKVKNVNANLITTSAMQKYVKIFEKEMIKEGRVPKKYVPDNPFNSIITENEEYLGISCSIYGSYFNNKSKSWSSKTKKLTKNHKLINYKHMYKELLSCDNKDFSMEYFNSFDYGKIKHFVDQDTTYVFEQLYDAVYTDAFLTKRNSLTKLIKKNKINVNKLNKDRKSKIGKSTKSNFTSIDNLNNFIKGL